MPRDKLEIDRQIYFEKVYQKYFKQTEAYILKNNGSRDDARDVFQEVMLILLEKLDDPDFEMTSSLSTYLYAVSRNLWLNKLKVNSKFIPYDSYVDIADVEEDNYVIELERKVSVWMGLITRHCRYVIEALFFLQNPLVNLAINQGWKNINTAYNQKYKCLQQLRKIKENEEKAGSLLNRM